jgi:ligand-binding sensor domain-containing protein/signal transduction histidine kinase
MWRTFLIRAGLMLTVAALLSTPRSVLAEQLPLRHYGGYDGLPHSNIRSILQDSRGYLWIGTTDGLSLFDGYRFSNYDTVDGLGHSFINSIAEDHQGRIWVATNGGGVSCFLDWVSSNSPVRAQPSNVRQKFVSFKLSDREEANRVNALVFDASGRLWCATDGGLYRARTSTGKIENIAFEAVVPHTPVTLAMGAFADSHGRLWFGIANQIIEAIGDHIIAYGPGPEFGSEVRNFAEDHEGHLLAATDSKLLELVEPSNQGDSGEWKTAPFDLTNYSSPYCLTVDLEGALWVGTEHGLLKYKGSERTVYTTSNGLSDDFVHAIRPDRDGNLWIGTDDGGVCMISGDRAVSFGRAEGLPDFPVEKLFEDHAGKVYISTKGGGVLEVTGRKVLPIEWSQTPEFSAIGPRIHQDRKGDWWVGTDRGLYWFRGANLRQARGVQITKAQGGPSTGVVGEIYEDPQGKLWFGSQDNSLFCIERSSPSGPPMVHSVPVTHHFPYRRIIEDRSGALWMATQSLLSRLIEGKDDLLEPVSGLPEIDTRSFFVDSRGWLWIGLRNKGVSVTKLPAANPLSFTNYSAADGLSSNTVWSIGEDSAGLIYLGTGRGLDQIDPMTGRVRHITAGESLMGEALGECMKDSHGNIWVATTKAVVRLDITTGSFHRRAPPIYLTKLYIAGAEFPIPDAGAIHGPSLTLGSSDNNLLIEYVALDFHSDHELKYQYKLDGADADWSPPTDQRSVNYARLAAGSYQFMVRAVNQEGIMSPEPAVVRIQVLPPVWRRWWFLLAAVAMVALAAYSAHRYRLSRLMELLKVRSRIASDLHDDIGSNLTKIAILSEVAQQQSTPVSGFTENPLTAIGRISRESVASMSDIVWAIDPRRDSYQDLIRRMRQFAIEMLGARVRFLAYGEDETRPLGPNFRRQVFLIFKETIHNAARHANCSRVEIEIRMERSGVTLTVRDNGTGFDTDSESDGQGLGSMRRRAESLNGRVEVISSGNGTTVTLAAPWTH